MLKYTMIRKLGTGTMLMLGLFLIPEVLVGQDQAKTPDAMPKPAVEQADEKEPDAKPVPAVFDVYKYALRAAKLKESGTKTGEIEVEPPEYFGLATFLDADEAKRKLMGEFVPKVMKVNSGGDRYGKHVDSVTSLFVYPDGQTVLSGSADKTAQLWKMNDKRPLQIFQDEFNHKQGITDVAVSPDLSRVLTASYDGSIRLWDTKNGKNTKAFLGLKDRVWAVAVAPGGQYVAGASDEGTIMVWNPQTMKKVGTLTGHAGAIYDLQCSTTGQYLISAGRDMVVRIWDMTQGREVQALSGHTDAVYSAIFSPGDNFVLTASRDKTARIWNTFTGEEVCRFVGHTGSVRRAIFIAPQVKVASSQQGQAGMNNPGGNATTETQTAQSVFVATASDDGSVRIWLPSIAQPRAKGAANDPNNPNAQDQSAVPGMPAMGMPGMGASANNSQPSINMMGGDTGASPGMGGQNARTQARVFTSPADHRFEDEEKEELDKDGKPIKKKKKKASSARPVGKNKGLELCHIQIPGNVGIYDLAVTPNSTRLVGACADAQVRIWPIPDITAELRKMQQKMNKAKGMGADGMMGGGMMGGMMGGMDGMN